jgi:hypothetical protein
MNHRDKCFDECSQAYDRIRLEFSRTLRWREFPPSETVISAEGVSPNIGTPECCSSLMYHLAGSQEARSTLDSYFLTLRAIDMSQECQHEHHTQKGRLSHLADPGVDENRFLRKTSKG